MNIAVLLHSTAGGSGVFATELGKRSRCRGEQKGESRNRTGDSTSQQRFHARQRTPHRNHSLNQPQTVSRPRLCGCAQRGYEAAGRSMPGVSARAS